MIIWNQLVQVTKREASYITHIIQNTGNAIFYFRHVSYSFKKSYFIINYMKHVLYHHTTETNQYVLKLRLTGLHSDLDNVC